jgi:hypothetical protein
MIGGDAKKRRVILADLSLSLPLRQLHYLGLARRLRHHDGVPLHVSRHRPRHRRAGNTPGGVIGWEPGRGHDGWLMNPVMVDCSR